MFLNSYKGENDAYATMIQSHSLVEPSQLEALMTHPDERQVGDT